MINQKCFLGFILLFASGCGMSGTAFVKETVNCTVKNGVVTCPDGTASNIVGPQGAQGKSGEDALQIVQQVLPAGSLCSSGNGNVLTFARDNANTGSYVQGDTVISSFLVCDGAAGQTGAQGVQGSQGIQGQTGAVGAQGPQGPAGAVGPAGSSGIAGQPGTQLTIVQFCPSSFVPTYPSLFPESGICINNKLYGVYSANDGFWAELPPGNYVSNGIGVSCAFTIGTNCSVSN